MILSGILHTSLGGFTVIRGVASLGDLARCSRFDSAYQRNLIETHRDEIEQFLADRQFLFFPEVVLSASLNFDYTKARGRSVEPLGDLFIGKGFTSNVDGLSVRVTKSKLPKGLEIVGGSVAPTLAFLDIPEEQLADADGLRLFRIDGNHRLSAVRDLKPGEATYQLDTPFCIVLHQDPTEKQRFEKVVFHNINAKQIPLTSEENLRLILQTGDGAVLFSDDDLLTKSSFGPAYWLARYLLPEFNTVFLGGLTKHFENKYTLALSLAQFLIAKSAVAGSADVAVLAPEVERVRHALIAVNACYSTAARQTLRISACHGVLTAFVYFALKNEGQQLPVFTRWIESNRIDRLSPATTTRGLGYHYHLGRTQSVDAASLVDVFESVLMARSREVFVSMQFGTPAGEEPVYKAIRAAIDEVNLKHGLLADLALSPVRIDHVNKGHSYTIADEILQVVHGCGLLIADLTQGNKNVYHEIGFLMGLNQGRTAEQDNFILLADNRKIQNDADIGFNLRHWQQVRFDDPLDLKTKLVSSLEQHFQLGTNTP
ncbi:hypothetical protein L2164_13290 [Pectobacterium brasiliense]|uniref:DGQHR domain-containing protein n=1 Tax=Pectobacterium odoriferum TaxID=78398 RepID=A0ABR4VVJ8_9GAMM|nr:MULTISPECIES: hypothetical protein [Pectobacterium]KGA43415.1 hypothetical protein KU75_01520 [Pectobacterium odoriferum]MCG5049670.1 hypothetical protein [Pectobacterium brasiliense]